MPKTARASVVSESEFGRDAAVEPGCGRVDASPEQQGQDRHAWQDWWDIIVGTFQALISDRCSMAAAGCAFYATLALFPTITTLISIYGLVFNRADIEPQLRYLHGLLPAPAFALIEDRVHELIIQPSGQLGIRLLVGSLVTFWSAATGTKSLLSALNVAYDVSEQRGLLQFQMVSLGMTLAGMVVAVLGLAVVVSIPVVINFIGLTAHATALIYTAAMMIMLAFVASSITVLFRIGPSRTRDAGQRIVPGTVVATLLWMLAGALLTFYVAHLSSFGVTYGSIAAVVGVMLWFYLTAYAVLVGAEFNAQLEIA
jgi:membrane protein